MPWPCYYIEVEKQTPELEEDYLDIKELFENESDLCSQEEFFFPRVLPSFVGGKISKPSQETAKDDKQLEFHC